MVMSHSFSVIVLRLTETLLQEERAKVTFLKFRQLGYKLRKDHYVMRHHIQ